VTLISAHNRYPITKEWRSGRRQKPWHGV